MKRVGVTLAVVLAAAGCGGKKKPPAPKAEAFSVVVAVRDDCLHHATAVARVPEAWLVASACGHTGEEGGEEELLTVRVDDRGLAAAAEPVHIVDAGWATNVLVAPVRGSGAIVSWTVARDRRAFAEAMPVDVQGRPLGGGARPLGEGRALAMSAGPGGAAMLLWHEPDTLSDVSPNAVAEIVLLVLDADARPVARQAVSGLAAAAHPAVGLAAGDDGYGVVWLEGPGNATIWGARVEGAGRSITRAAIVEPAGVVAGSRLAWPVVTLARGGAARIAFFVEIPGQPSPELWWGEGTLGGAASSWRFKRVLEAGEHRRERLAVAAHDDGAATLVWVEVPRGRDFGQLMWMRVAADGTPVSPPSVAAGGAVIFDGFPAVGSHGGAAITAAATPPAGAGGGEQSSISLTQRLSPE
jgi:hypothetical protein